MAIAKNPFPLAKWRKNLSIDNPTRAKEIGKKISKSNTGIIKTTGNHRMVKVECAYCGAPLIRKAYRAKKNNYCNTSHQMKYEYKHGRDRKPHPNLYIAIKEKLVKSNHYAWQGGTKEATMARMRDTAWHKLRLIIYARDKWKCQICGIHGSRRIKLHCHHIVPYRVTQDNSEENLITLCAKCHTTEEQKYLHSLKGQLEFNFGYQAS